MEFMGKRPRVGSYGGRDARLTTLLESVLTNGNRLTMHGEQAVVAPFVSMANRITGKMGEPLAASLAALDGNELQDIVNLCSSASGNVATRYAGIGKMIFKGEHQLHGEWTTQLKALEAMLGSAVECMVAHAISDDAGNTQWARLTKLCTDLIVAKAAQTHG